MLRHTTVRTAVRTPVTLFGILALLMLSGCDGDVQPLDLSSLDSLCPAGIGGYAPECCDSQGSMLLANLPNSCQSGEDGGTDSALLSGFTSIQFALDELEAADEMVDASSSGGLPYGGAAGVGAGNTGGSATTPGSSDALVSSGPARTPLTSGDGTGGSIVRRITQAATAFFGGELPAASTGDLPDARSALPATGAGRLPESNSNSANSNSTLASSDTPGASRADALPSGGRSASDAGSLSDGPSGSSGRRTGRAGVEWNQSSAGLEAAGGAPESVEFGAGSKVGRTLASVLNGPIAPGSSDPDDYFGRIRPEENLFKRVTLKYRQKENEIARLRIPSSSR